MPGMPGRAVPPRRRLRACRAGGGRERKQKARAGAHDLARTLYGISRLYVAVRGRDDGHSSPGIFQSLRVPAGRRSLYVYLLSLRAVHGRSPGGKLILVRARGNPQAHHRAGHHGFCHNVFCMLRRWRMISRARSSLRRARLASISSGHSQVCTIIRTWSA